MAYMLQDMTNEIYDDPHSGAMGIKDDNSPYALFLGVFVTLLPKLIPIILPSFVGSEELKARFNEDTYSHDVEELFRQKFSENLGMIEKVILAWKSNSISLADFGLNLHPDNPLARDDFIAGEPAHFQDSLLMGIEYLRDRVARSHDPEDRITKMSNNVWMVGSTVYRVVSKYLSGGYY